MTPCNLPWNRQIRPKPYYPQGMRRGIAHERVRPRLQAEALAQVLDDPQSTRTKARFMVDVDCRHRYRVVDVQHGLRMVVEPHAIRAATVQKPRAWPRVLTLAGAAACLLGAAALLLTAASPPGAAALAGLGLVLAVGLLVDALRKGAQQRAQARKNAAYAASLQATLAEMSRATQAAPSQGASRC